MNKNVCINKPIRRIFAIILIVSLGLSLMPISPISAQDPYQGAILSGSDEYLEVTTETGDRSSTITISVRNDGTETWYNSGTNIVTINYRYEPTDTPGDNGNTDSHFGCTDWITEYRVSTMNETSVAPGQTATFDFWMCNEHGESTSSGYWQEHFALAYGGNWMSDGAGDVPKFVAHVDVIAAEYDIRGYVRDSNNNGMSGVTIDFGGARPSDTTSSSGYYSQSGFTNGTYTVTPSKTDCTFTPTSRSVTVNNGDATNIDFTATCSQEVWEASILTASPIQIDVPENGDNSQVTVISVQNNGNTTWSNSGTDAVCINYRYEPTDTDGDNGNTDSHFGCADWLSAYRVSCMNEASVAPGGTATFDFWMCNEHSEPASSTYDWHEHFALGYGSNWMPDGAGDVAKFIADIRVVGSSYTISGYVRDGSNNSISGVTVSFGGAQPDVTTDGTGYYGQSGFVNGNYTVTPSKSGYTFTPMSQNVTVNGGNQANINFTGTQNVTTYTISGYVRDGNSNGISGVTISFGGARPNVTTDGTGYYSQAGFANGNYTVTPSKSGYTFNPASQNVAVNGGNQANVNFATSGSGIWCGRWISQVQIPSGGVGAGQQINVKVVVQNEGTEPWVNNPSDSNAVGIYVRKQCASTIGPIDDESGGSIFSCSDWGSNRHRAAWMKESVVNPGELATFEFTLCTDNVVQGNYREDFGIAHGGEWIDNPYNGDPAGKLAVWVSISINAGAIGPILPIICESVEVNGQVTSQKDGSGIPNARVSIGGQVAQTNANGYYTLNNLMPGNHTVRIEAGGYESHKGNIEVQVNSSTIYNVRLNSGPVSTGYYLPYPGGVSYRCSQGIYSGISHKKLWAFDFAMGEASIIVASNDGKVDDIRGGYNGGYGKYIRLKHRDGTYTVYTHIIRAVDNISVGKEVFRGTRIALSGGKQGGVDQGWSTGWHLHFHRGTQLNTYGIPISQRVTFQDVPGNGIPIAKKSYESGNYLSPLNSTSGTTFDSDSPIGSIEFLLTGEPTHTLRLDVFDYESDFTWMRPASAYTEVVNTNWTPYTRTFEWLTSEAWVQYKDESGNLSEIYSDTIDTVAFGPVNASFTVANQMACTGIPVSIENQTTPFCEQCGWIWDLGNGINSLDSYSPLYEAIYFESGNYTITLSVTGLMNTSVMSRQISVLSSPTPAFTTSVVGNTITVYANDIDAAEWLWNFGDGITTTGRIATHVYNPAILSEGALVYLTVKGTNGCVAEAYEIIQSTPYRVYLPVVVRQE